MKVVFEFLLHCGSAFDGDVIKKCNEEKKIIISIKNVINK